MPLKCGKGEIRTLDTLSGMPLFESGAFNHSATFPKPTAATLPVSFSFEKIRELFRLSRINYKVRFYQNIFILKYRIKTKQLLMELFCLRTNKLILVECFHLKQKIPTNHSTDDCSNQIK